jgi:hypothetical protein
MRDRLLVKSGLFGAVALVTLASSAFVLRSEGDSEVWTANLLWPLIAGFPLYYATSHGLPRLLCEVSVLWGLQVVPCTTAYVVVRLATLALSTENPVRKRYFARAALCAIGITYCLWGRIPIGFVKYYLWLTY